MPPVTARMGSSTRCVSFAARASRKPTMSPRSPRVGAVNDKMCNIADPHTSTEAKFSMRLMAAYAFHDVDTARLDAFGETQIADPRVRAMREKIVIVSEAGLTMTQAVVTAKLTDGREINAEHDASLPERDTVKLTERLRQSSRLWSSPFGRRRRKSNLRQYCAVCRSPDGDRCNRGFGGQHDRHCRLL